MKQQDRKRPGSKRGRRAVNPPAESSASPVESPDLRTILDILRAKGGHDFNFYKSNTLERRIQRRMTLNKIETLAEYARFLQDNPEEAGLLQKDLLIGVTEFFRQPEAWEILDAKVIAPLVEKTPPGSEIRVWVPGCSTGEEAYGLAILLAERIQAAGKEVGFQIFATDYDADALAAARAGTYPEEAVAGHVTPERMKRFFICRDGCCQVMKDIRARIVFAPHNLTADPPFSRQDLVSCRNLLIYLDAEVQRKVVALFHFALREGGSLFLGSAETVGDRVDLFEPVSKKWRIYRRIGVGRAARVEIPFRPVGPILSPRTDVPGPPSPARQGLAAAAQQFILDRFAPACVIIDRKLRVLYLHGPVEQFLTFPAGELTTRVVDIAREGLRVRLGGAISKCLETRRPVQITARVRRGTKSVPVKATVSPLKFPREIDGLLMIDFKDYAVSAAKPRRTAAGNNDVRQLQDELKITREELQSTIVQLEGSNDQLKASNEEVTASNEELQSANEELETSKEELQSLNEELNTINVRLQEKVEELEGVNNDLLNLLESTAIATVFLDREFNVRRYTPASTRLFSLIPTDLGRPIADILRRFEDDALIGDALRVLADLAPLSKEVRSDDGRWYIRRITPYRTLDNRILGVVVTFVDVCDIKKTEAELREAREQAEWLARMPGENPNPVVRVSAEGFALYVNPAAAATAGWQFRVGRPLPEPLRGMTVRAAAEAKPVDEEMELGGTPFSVAIVPMPEAHYVNIYGKDITERKKAEDALRGLNEQLETRVAEQTAEIRATHDAVEAERRRLYDVLETLPAYVVLLDKDYRAPFANRFFRERFGEAHGRRCYEFLFERADPCPGCETYKVLQTNAPHHWEWTGPDGRNYDVHDFPFPDADGSTLILEMGIDVTEIKRAEAALKELNETLERRVAERAGELAASEERYRIVFETANEGIWVTDGERKTTLVNQKMADMLGYARDELLGRIPATFLHPDQEAVAFKTREAIKAGRKTNQEFKFRRKDGSDLWVISSASPVIDAEGRLAKTISMLTDISERKRLEEERLRAEIAERLRLVAAVEQTGVGIAITDPAGRITYVNPAFERTSGARSRELLGTSYFDLVTGEAGDAGATERLQARARKGEPWSDRLSRRNKEGQEIELDVTFSPLRNLTGAITDFLAVESDVTREVRIQRQLRQIQKIEALGTLAGGIAHDFNNILNPIFINTELVLLDPGLDPQARLSLETSLKAAERGRDLVKQIITFSRQKEKERKPSKVTPVLKEALKFVRASLPSTIEIKADLGVETGTILSDPAQIHQVVMNLCNNAAYAMRDKGGVLEVKLAEVEVDADMTALHSDLRPGPYVRLTVADTGTGMKPDVMERAFDPFFTTKKPGEGSGMGLAVVHGIVRDQGGAVTVYSELGRGSVFNVFFPRFANEEAAPAVDVAAPERGSERILLVDDEEVQVESVRKMLERLGYTVTAAAGGEEALASFLRDPASFDLVITDQTMPHMTGLELASQILRVRPGLPVVLCTGFSEIVDANAAQAAGIRGFQMKPFSLREMAGTVRAALGDHPKT